MLVIHVAAVNGAVRPARGSAGRVSSNNLVQMAISKVERLVNLVIALLSTRGYITAEKIRSSVAGYSDSPSAEAFSRMFERDKNELRDLGIPLEVGRVSVMDPTEGYRINRDAYALPPVELTPDEAAAVAVATQLWESPELVTEVIPVCHQKQLPRASSPWPLPPSCIWARDSATLPR